MGMLGYMPQSRIEGRLSSPSLKASQAHNDPKNEKKIQIYIFHTKLTKVYQSKVSVKPHWRLQNNQRKTRPQCWSIRVLMKPILECCHQSIPRWTSWRKIKFSRYTNCIKMVETHQFQGFLKRWPFQQQCCTGNYCSIVISCEQFQALSSNAAYRFQSFWYSS